jgi:lipoate synthase
MDVEDRNMAEHVSPAEFDRTVSLAQHEGFAVTDHPLIRLSHTVVLTKPCVIEQS